MKRRSFLMGMLAGLFAPKLAAERLVNVGIDGGGLDDSVGLAVFDFETGERIWFSGDSYVVRADAFLAALPKFVQEVNSKVRAWKFGN